MRKSKPEAIIALAHHEAGHAVIARALGLELDSVTIIPDLDLDTLGLCTHESPTNNALILYPDDYATLLPAIEKGVMVTLAGLHAECRYTGQMWWCQRG
jgi:hypothetical protein